MLFHELTHQQIYIDDDTTFNESLASAVQQVGTELWLESRNQRVQLEKLSRWLHYRGEVIALIETTRERLAKIYDGTADEDRKRELKARIFAETRSAHDEIASRHGITGGYTHWFAEGLNNAKIGSIAAYNSEMPAFINMIRAHQLNFAAFFDYVAAVGALDKPVRDKCLQDWRQQAQAESSSCPSLQRVVATAS